MPVQLAELAIHMPAAIALFEKYGFNYYQDGRQTFRQACEEKNLSFYAVDAELKSLQHYSAFNYLLTLEDMDLARLVNFINGQHHASEEEVPGFIRQSIKKISESNGCETGLLKLLNEAALKFAVLEKKLLSHCHKEDKLLFPQLRKLFEARRDQSTHDFLQTVLQVKAIIKTLEEEHREAILLFSDIKQLLDGFAVPAAAPGDYKLLMDKLREFECGFHVHLHIENNVLFPKFAELEEALKGILVKH